MCDSFVINSQNGYVKAQMTTYHQMISPGCEGLIGRNWCFMCAKYEMSPAVLVFNGQHVFLKIYAPFLFHRGVDVV